MPMAECSRRRLRLPDFRDYALKVDRPGTIEVENVPPLGNFLRDVMKLNMSNFRVFGPDETTSNKLQAIYQAAKKFWIAEYFPEDKDGGELATDGRVIEMLSEHTMEGMLEGYLLTGRNGFLLVLRSLRPRHRLDVQPAREVAFDLQSSVAGGGRLPR